MASPTFDGRISLGNWITIATVLIAIGSAWQSVGALKDTVGKSQVEVQVKLDAIQFKQSEMHDKQMEADFRLKRVEKLLDDHIAATDVSAERTRQYQRSH